MAQPSSWVSIHEEDVSNVVLTGTSAGVCLRGCHRRTGRQVSVKLLSCRATSDSDWRNHMRDAALLGRVCSERVLVPLGVYRTRFLAGLVWDWMPEGSLHSLLNETHLFPDLPVSLRLRVLSDVAEGLSHLHAIPLPHLSLKPTNVLLDHHYRAKLCDWGQPRLWDTGLSLSDGARPCFRDLAYLSPEVLQGTTPSVEADLYSFGVLLWETLNRRRPCEDTVQLQTLLSAQQGARPGVEGDQLPPDTPHGHALTQLMIGCWRSEPRNRPVAEECVLELRKAVLTFDPGASAKAALQLRERKERALLSCKHLPTWDVQIEINNVEGFGDYSDPKNMLTKTLPLDVPHVTVSYPRIPSSNETTPSRSPPAATAVRDIQDVPQTRCYRDYVNPSPAAPSGANSRAPPGHSPPPPQPPCGSPTARRQGPLHQPSVPSNQAAPCVSAVTGRSCCRLLREGREGIVRRMTEGRLNNLLDVLRARRALSLEAYELIVAALTLAARTRSLLDTCACLGESAAALVAATLGLVPAGNAHGRAQPSR